MRINVTAIARRIILATWLVLLATVVGLAALNRLAPMADHQVIVIRGASMTPAIPLGSLVVLRSSGFDRIAPGDIVTLELPSGVLVTHRVLRVAPVPDGTFLETMGDANDHPDEALAPIEAVVGVVELHVPYAGFVLAFLSIPTGMLSAVSLLASLLLAAVLLEDERPARRPGSVVPGVPAGGRPA